MKAILGWCALLREVGRCICGYAWKHVSVRVCVLKKKTTSSCQEMPEVTTKFQKCPEPGFTLDRVDDQSSGE